MGLDFNYTCGNIDSNIKDFKSVIEDCIDDILHDACPLFSGAEKTKFIQSQVEKIYNDCENIFEELRKCNSDMRDQAELQISELEDNLDNITYERDELQKKVDTLENDLSESESRCEKLEDQCEYLENKIAF